MPRGACVYLEPGLEPRGRAPASGAPFSRCTTTPPTIRLLARPQKPMEDLEVPLEAARSVLDGAEGHIHQWGGWAPPDACSPGARTLGRCCWGCKGCSERRSMNIPSLEKETGRGPISGQLSSNGFCGPVPHKAAVKDLTQGLSSEEPHPRARK